MKIGFDGKRAVNNFTGLGNYSRLIIDSLANRFPSDEFHLYSPSTPDKETTLFGSNCKNIRHHSPLKPINSFKKSLWRSFGVTQTLSEDKIDLFHGLSNELPLNIVSAGIPSIVTIHDLIYRTLPSCYPLPDRLIYNLKYGLSCRNATAIIAISECTKRDIIRFYKVPEDKIHVIYQGCHPDFRPATDKNDIETDRSVMLGRKLHEQYLLQVGTIETRKNALLSVRALSAIENKKIPLILVGKPTPYLNKITAEARRLGVADRLKVLTDVSSAELPSIVRNASIAIYPSLYEGFGLPVLEAISCGVPVIAAKGSCLEEAGGKDSIYIRPDEVSDLKIAIDSLLSNQDLTQKITEKGLRYARNFDHLKSAERIHELYERLLCK